MKQINQSRRNFSLSLAALGSTSLIGQASAQSNYPSRPVRLYVGASAGGAPDAMARTMAKLLAESWGQTVVVDNKPGLSGFLAAEVTAQSAPDGLSVCLVLDTVINTVPLLSEKLNIDPLKELKPIGMVGSFPLVLVSNPTRGYSNLQQVIAAAKANPGKLEIGTSGVGSSGHVATEVLTKAAGITLNHVPYKGGLPAIQDTVAGHIGMMWSSVGAAMPLINTGKLTPLAVGSTERFALLPNVGTVQEQGYPGFTAGNWVALMGPAALPDAIREKIYSDVLKLSGNQVYRDTLLAQGIEARTAPSAELAKLMRSEYERNKVLFSSLGLLANK